MFEKLLLAATITFSLNLFIGISVQSTQQPTVASPSTTAQANQQPVYLAKALQNPSFLRSLFQ
ncbi:MAG: hypothetical protein ACAF41_09785 [Leptolyngbya sp. BL-A-14]